VETSGESARVGPTGVANPKIVVAVVKVLVDLLRVIADRRGGNAAEEAGTPKGSQPSTGFVMTDENVTILKKCISELFSSPHPLS